MNKNSQRRRERVILQIKLRAEFGNLGLSFKFAVPFGGRISKSGFKDDFDGILTKYAGVAQLVEHHLAKVRVASSSLVSRSEMKKCEPISHFFLLHLPWWWSR